MEILEILFSLAIGSTWFIGAISGYHERPTRGTIEWRQEQNQLPAGAIDDEWIMVAVNDCGLIGETGRMWVEERGWLEEGVMVFDCKGETSSEWMSASGEASYWKVALEVGWNDWEGLVGTGKRAIVVFSH